MANDTIPMKEMFNTCSQILDRELTPIHYKTLTEMALQELGVNPTFVNIQRQIEDVREKMLCTGRFDTVYVPSPFCLGAKKLWFARPLLISPDDEAVVIPGHAQHGAEGAFEALMRDGEMIQKNPHASIERVKMARAKGLVLERHVAGWFKENWAGFYRPPDNEGQWKHPCDHDFKLTIDGQIWKVDVFGPNAKGNFADPGNGKRKVDLHLACEIIGQNALWRSIFTGKEYSGKLTLATGISPKRMVVWLNCLRDGIDYDTIRHYAMN